MNSIHCPFCQHENEINSTQCKHCGTPFIPPNIGPLTTYDVPQLLSYPGRQQHADFEKRVAQLSENTLALFIADQDEPIILTNPHNLIFGRGDIGESDTMIDLTKYGALTLGISRHHARVNFADNIFTLEDLNSTNGTWVNRKRLQPGQTCQLQHGDQLSLGPLRVLVGLKTAASAGASTFILQQRSADSTPRLTPSFFMNQVTPYLQALWHTYQIRTEFQGKKAEHIYILSITEHKLGLSVIMTGTQQILPPITKWVVPWRLEHPELLAHSQEATDDSLTQLAVDLLIETKATTPVDFVYIEKIIPALKTLVTSQLEPVIYS